MRGRSLLVIGVVLLIAVLASSERVKITEQKPDALEQLIGNSFLSQFIPTKSTIDIKKFYVGSKVILLLYKKFQTRRSEVIFDLN